MKNIAILMSCHNRKEKTIACLDALFQNKLPNGFALEVFLVIDGSSDGTGEAVRNKFSRVRIINGDGNLYWGGGMHLAYSTAMKQKFDYYLWLNDDTVLFNNALSKMLITSMETSNGHCNKAIIVGATQDEIGGVTTYGGLVKGGWWRPLKLNLSTSLDEPVNCDTMNGNCVLIPSFVSKKLGNLDEAFLHAMGDIDYGFRARKAGFAILAMPGYAGLCSRNSLTNTHADKSLSKVLRWKQITSYKELPIRAWFTLTKRHTGILWPIYFLWPYLKVLLGRRK
jgi:GT2 family glycosyltransferase